MKQTTKRAAKKSPCQMKVTKNRPVKRLGEK
jgi:hypothetical protein